MSAISQCRVMIIDDVLDSVLIVSDILEDLCKVITPAAGMPIVDAVAQQTPDLLLLDVLMPGVDGFAICQALKRNPDTAEIPVIFLTSLSNTENKLVGFSAGGVDYITKPFHAAEVRARVLTHLKLSLSERENRQHIKYLSNALAHSEESYLFFAEHTADILFQTDSNGVINLINSTWTEVTAQDRGSAIGKTVPGLVDERDREDVEKALKHALDVRHEDLHMQLRLPTAKGPRWMQASFRFRYGPIGEHFGLTGVFTDVSDLMDETEALIRKTRSSIEMIFNSISELNKHPFAEAEKKSLDRMAAISKELNEFLREHLRERRSVSISNANQSSER